MNRSSLVRLGAFLICVVFVSQAFSHYLWVTIDDKTGDHGTTNVYFEGGPSPGDGQFLDPFIKRGTTWIRTVSSSKATPLEMKVVKQPGKRWLSAALPEARPRSIDSYCEYGVSSVGGRMLSYYARNLEVSSHDDLNKLARAEHLTLEIVPRDEGDDLEITVLWQGKPAAGLSLSARGPMELKQALTTDENGQARISPKASGQYRFHAVRKNKKNGTYEGKKFQVIEHHATLLMKLPLGAK